MHSIHQSLFACWIDFIFLSSLSCTIYYQDYFRNIASQTDTDVLGSKCLQAGNFCVSFGTYWFVKIVCKGSELQQGKVKSICGQETVRNVCLKVTIFRNRSNTKEWYVIFDTTKPKNRTLHKLNTQVGVALPYLTIQSASTLWLWWTSVHPWVRGHCPSTVQTPTMGVTMNKKSTTTEPPP